MRRTDIEAEFVRELTTFYTLQYRDEFTNVELGRYVRETDSNKIVQNQISSLKSRITEGKDNPKYELNKSLRQIWMVPSQTAEGERFYFGVAQWAVMKAGVPILFTFFKSSRGLGNLTASDSAGQQRQGS